MTITSFRSIVPLARSGRRFSLALAALALAIGAPSAHAQAPSARSATDAEYLVPPQGSVADVPVHFEKICILSFPERLSSDAITSSTDYEVQAWGKDGLAVAVRAIKPQTGSATLALATLSGRVKVNVTLRVVPDGEPALTMIRFKPASEVDAFEARVQDATTKRMAPLLQQIEQREQALELAKQALESRRQALDVEARKRADLDMTDRILRYGDILELRTHARNSDNVILHAERSYIIGETGYLTFEIQNRSSRPYLLAKVRLIADKRDVAGDVRLLSTAIVQDPALIGIVSPGARARGIVAVPAVQPALNRPLILEISMPNGRSVVRLDRKLEIR